LLIPLSLSYKYITYSCPLNTPKPNIQIKGIRRTEYSEVRITSWEATLESNKFIADTLRVKLK